MFALLKSTRDFVFAIAWLTANLCIPGCMWKRACASSLCTPTSLDAVAAPCAHPAGGPKRSALHTAGPFPFVVFFLFPTHEHLDPVFALQQEGSKSGEGVLLHPHSSPRYAAQQGKWNPSLILDGCTHRHGSEECSVAAVLKGVLNYRATSTFHHRSEVIGRELSVEDHRHGKKLSTSFTIVKCMVISYDMLLCCVIFGKLVNPIDGHDIKLSLS